MTASSLSFSNKRITATAGFTFFINTFRLYEGGQSILLPSSISQSSLTANYRLHSLIVESDLTLRHTSGQHNKALHSPQERHPSDALEWNITAQNTFTLSSKFSIAAGVRLAVYHIYKLNLKIKNPDKETYYKVFSKTASMESRFYGTFLGTFSGSDYDEENGIDITRGVHSTYE